MTPDGTIEQTGDRTVIRFERELAHPVDRVWAALTEPRQLLAWWGDADVDLDDGRFTVRWLNTDDEGNSVTMAARITALEPPRLLEMEGEPHGVLRFELEPAGERTRLRFTSTLQLPDEFRTKVLAGWHFHLDALATALDGGSTDLEHVEGWEPIHDAYVTAAS
jgi:uncharacterized protein YndB with AHSA1/START domain